MAIPSLTRTYAVNLGNGSTPPMNPQVIVNAIANSTILAPPPPSPAEMKDDD
jgi:hypothetical protein